jgi:putative peptidoglycan lipid II flippase
MLQTLHHEAKTIASAAMLVGVLSFISRVVGFIRDRILAGTFGAGDTLDVYYAAFKIPDLLFNLLVIGALSASFIPLFIKRYEGAGGKEDAWKLTNNALNIIAVTMAVCALGLFVFAPSLSQVIAPGFFGPKQDRVADFTRVLLLAEWMLAVSVVFGSVLQGLKRFFLFALAPVAYNVGIIFGALVLTDFMGPIGLAFGVVAGAFLHFLVQGYGVLQSGYRYQWIFHGRDRDVRAMMRLMGPRVLALAVSQINFILMAVIGSGLAVGSVTIFTFAYNIHFLPIGIIGVSYAIAAFPVLALHAEHQDWERLRQSISGSVRQILFFIIPLTLLFLVLRMQIVRVVVGAGAFGWEETIATANTLAFFTLSLFAQCLVFLLSRVFFALHDTATPLGAGLVSAVVGLLGGLYFSREAGVVGLALAYSLAALVNLVLLWIPLRVRLQSLCELSILRSLYILSVAGLVAGVVMQLAKPLVVQVIPLDTFLGVLTQGLVAGGLGLFTYGLIARLLKSPEMEDLMVSLRRRAFRAYRLSESLPPDTTVS